MQTHQCKRVGPNLSVNSKTEMHEFYISFFERCLKT